VSYFHHRIFLTSNYFLLFFFQETNPKFDTRQSGVMVYEEIKGTMEDILKSFGKQILSRDSHQEGRMYLNIVII